MWSGFSYFNSNLRTRWHPNWPTYISETPIINVKSQIDGYLLEINLIWISVFELDVSELLSKALKAKLVRVYLCIWPDHLCVFCACPTYWLFNIIKYVVGKITNFLCRYLLYVILQFVLLSGGVGLGVWRISISYIPTYLLHIAQFFSLVSSLLSVNASSAHRFCPVVKTCVRKKIMLPVLDVLLVLLVNAIWIYFAGMGVVANLALTLGVSGLLCFRHRFVRNCLRTLPRDIKYAWNMISFLASGR